METSEIFEYEVPSESKGLRLDIFLQNHHPDISRSQLKRLIQESQVSVNGISRKAAYILKEKDRIKLEIPPPKPLHLIPEAIPIDIQYEDEDLIIINKSAEMVVHPGSGIQEGTLVHAILHHCQDLSGIGGALRPGIVHRLDKGTSGVMVIAKHDQAHLRLSELFKSRDICKEYEAIIWGALHPDHGTIESAIGRDPKDRTKISSRGHQTREAITEYKTLKTYGEFSHLRIIPKTGRTHQIRVHLSEQGHPIVGDPTYGRGQRKLAKLSPELQSRVQAFPFQLLHAARLKFTHPLKDKIIDISVPLRTEMVDFIEFLEKEATS